MLSCLIPCLVLASTILAQSTTVTIKYGGSEFIDKCLSVENSTSNLTVVINDCGNCSSPIPWQVWEIETSPSLIKLVNHTVPNADDVPRNICLNAAKDADSQASVVSVSDCTSAISWKTTLDTPSVIYTQHGLCLDLSSNDTTNNRPNSVLTWSCNGPEGQPLDNQKWKIQLAKTECSS